MKHIYQNKNLQKKKKSCATSVLKNQFRANSDFAPNS